MNCIQMVSFVVLINGSASLFLHVQRGFYCQDCPLYPILFLPVVEELSHLLSDAKRTGVFQGSLIARNMAISLLLFIDDILIFFSQDVKEILILADILTLFGHAIGMSINPHKSSIYYHNFSEV